MHRHESCITFTANRRSFSHQEGPIRTVVVSLIGVAAIAAGVALLRQDRESGDRNRKVREVPPGESIPSTIVLERLRQAGI